MDKTKTKWDIYREICKKNETWCSKCELQIKEGLLKGLCGVRDNNGLTPNQELYGNTF
ncbi:MAG: hypothetical protein H0Z24_07005 [Thermosipho sp. (in: Bacteria)]|nr:hypothetical protein [Thermosipho sp. (in: thermotogales)]